MNFTTLYYTLLYSTRRRLRDENEKLQAELGAFDLDFFEEVEDLKVRVGTDLT